MKYYGSPCDIEWAKEKGKFYITQSRPIITLKKDQTLTKNNQEIQQKYFKQRFDAMFNVIYSFVYYFYEKISKFYNFQFDLAVFILEDHKLTCLYDNKNLKNLGNHIVDKILMQEEYLNVLIDDYNLAVRKFNQILNEIDNMDLTSIDYKKLSVLNNRLNDSASTIIPPSFIEPVSIVLQGYVENEIRNFINDEKKIKKYSNILTETYHYSFLQEEELSRLKILQEIITKKVDFKDIKKDKEILRDLKKHQSNYFWIKNNYETAKDLVLNDFIKSIKETNKDDLKKLEYDRISDIKKRKLKILKTIKSPKLIVLSKICDELTHVHDDRKKQLLIYQTYLWKLLDEFSKRKKLSRKQICWYTPKELEKDKKLSLSEIKRRKSLTVLLYKQGEKILLTGKKASVWRKEAKINHGNVEELVGSIASPGKAIGKVKVLSSIKEINKIKHGEILVASNTTPDYIPAMKKASAFLTEKGGITSHAAIIAREMQKPCIVGIEDIIFVLKDNDIVEVDANRGVVRVFKKIKK